jgi:soluble lytic murein transglycosylase
MEAASGKPLRSAEDWRRRGDSFFRARRNVEALEAYEQALARGLSASRAVRVRNLSAQVLFRMRRYPEAVDAFGALPQKDDVPIWHARSLARAGRVPESIAAFEEIARRRRGGHALRARFLAALLLEGRGETAPARAYFESLTRDRAGSAVRLASLWRLGWGAYLEGRHADAIAAIDRLIVGEQDPIEGLRSRYWRARSLERLGSAAEGPDPHAAASARAEFEAIALGYPFTYYGWRSRERLPEAVRASASQRPVPPAPTLRQGTRKLSADSLERVRILLEAGLAERARDELARVARQVGGLEDRLAVAQLMRDAGSFNAAQQLVLDTYPETLARGPRPTLEELWWHAWPAAYLDLVEAAAPLEAGVDASLVFSIMREESGFRAQVISPVGARGLLQIMEPTGRRLARAVGRPSFHVDDLFDPQVNVELGSYYLGELFAQFDGRLSPAIASYNAGPEAVGRWLDENGHLEEDEWVEAIPYDETRSYVKRVLRSLQAYRLLY